jgi:thiamine biosynthesis protein ThiS
VNNDAHTIVLNGKVRPIHPAQTLTDLLAELDLKERLVVVERNGEILARTAYATTSIEPGDVLEIVHFVGGG